MTAAPKSFRSDQWILEPPWIADECSSTLPETQYPTIIAYPESTEQIIELLQYASLASLPVFINSTGKNWGYGCRSGPVSGGITVLLEKMNRILEVNVELGYAVIEPGVTYQQLNSYLKAKNIPLWADVAGTTEAASVLGNALDKGRGLTPYADHFGQICGMNVVLPDGTVMSTSADPKMKAKHLYKWSVGPYVEGLFAQSNFGVVVSAGIWLMPKPDDFLFCAFEYTATATRFASFIDAVRGLVFSGGLRAFPHIANDFAMLCIVDRYPQLSSVDGRVRTRLSTSELSHWKKRHGVKDWTFGAGLYGDEASVLHQKRMISGALKSFGAVRFFKSSDREGFIGGLQTSTLKALARLQGKSQAYLNQLESASGLFQGIPTDAFAKQVYVRSSKGKPTYLEHPARDKCGFVWTGPIVPFLGSEVASVHRLVEPIFLKYEFDLFCEWIIESPRALIGLFGVFFDLANEEERENARHWYTAINRVLKENGYPEYRTSAMTTTHALDTNPELKDFLAKLKTSIDAEGILAPGRYGVKTIERN